VRLDLFHEPEPDIVLLRPRGDFYASAHPGPRDVLLVIEFAESSIDYDRSIKSRVYAQARLTEYWLVDLNEDVVHVHVEPFGGVYRKVTSCRRGASLAPRVLSSCAIPTVDLLGE
jgi:Uma2 family endonuclease